jgi:hypothetical protein
VTGVPAGKQEAEPPRAADGPGQSALVLATVAGQEGVAVALGTLLQVTGALGGDGLDDERVHVSSFPL